MLPCPPVPVVPPEPVPPAPLLPPFAVVPAVYDAFSRSPFGKTTGIALSVLPSTITVTVAVVIERPSVPEHATPNSVARVIAGVTITPEAPPVVSLVLPGPKTVQLAMSSPVHESFVVVPTLTRSGFAEICTNGIIAGVVVACCGVVVPKIASFSCCMIGANAWRRLPSWPRFGIPPAPADDESGLLGEPGFPGLPGLPGFPGLPGVFGGVVGPFGGVGAGAGFGGAEAPSGVKPSITLFAA